MEFYQVRYFLSLCDTLNFTRAAEHCNVSQPSLTRAVKLLEDELGGPLFHRERNHTHLTELGKLMRPYFEQVQTQTLEAKEHARRMLTLANGSLRIGVMNSIATTRMIGMFANFQKDHPGIEVDIRSACAVDLCDSLAAGDVDTAIYASPEEEPEEFCATPLFSERILVGVGRGHRFERLNAIRLEDLSGERYLVRERCEYVPYINKLLEDGGVELEGRCKSDRDDWITAMAASGLGFCFLPEDAVGQETMVVRPLIEPELSRTTQLITARGRPHSAALGAFLGAAKKFGKKRMIAVAA